MKLLQTAIGQNRDQIEGLFPGVPKEYSIDAGVPFAFPPAADFPGGGLFSIRVPAGAVVSIRGSGAGDGYVLDPGHWRLGFIAGDTHVLTSAAGADIAVLPFLEV